MADSLISSNSSSQEIQMKMSIKNENNKNRLMSTNFVKIPDALLEIQQIEQQQKFLCQQINQIDREQQQLEDLLDQLRSMKSNQNSKYNSRLSERSYSSDSDSDVE